ncbi:MAG TPA: DUF2905 domain-containing protein [Burkholderiales bacterium]|jgi:hypothetical protein|nr:DUF2905 domain-containing protein [Burkholderiales bacterium]
MVKWILTVFVALAILSIAIPPGGRRISSRFVLGRLPGDFRIPLRDRVLYIPLASTLVLSFLVWLIGRIL